MGLLQLVLFSVWKIYENLVKRVHKFQPPDWKINLYVAGIKLQNFALFHFHTVMVCLRKIK